MCCASSARKAEHYQLSIANLEKKINRLPQATMHFLYLLPLVAQVYHALAATPEQWRSRSIYQVVTDRFARTDGSTSAPCDAGLGKYCGGTWNGLMDKLDYIQGMGFDAVWWPSYPDRNVCCGGSLLTGKGLDLAHNLPRRRSDGRSTILPWILATGSLQNQPFLWHRIRSSSAIGCPSLTRHGMIMMHLSFCASKLILYS
jgi:hypothetical protein